MSQQINLLLPELRPRFDWLGLPVVAGAALLSLLLVAGLAIFSMLSVQHLKADEAAINARATSLQQQVQSLAQAMAARQGNSALVPQIAALRSSISQRREVLEAIHQGPAEDSRGFSAYLQAFGKQTLDGVWLVGFAFAHKDIEIRGRLTEPSLLPRYIGKLNSEAIFAGRHFAALDMTGVDPTVVSGDPAVAPVKVKAPTRYTEFVLRTEQMLPETKR